MSHRATGVPRHTCGLLVSASWWTGDRWACSIGGSRKGARKRALLWWLRMHTQHLSTLFGDLFSFFLALVDEYLGLYCTSGFNEDFCNINSCRYVQHIAPLTHFGNLSPCLRTTPLCRTVIWSAKEVLGPSWAPGEKNYKRVCVCLWVPWFAAKHCKHVPLSMSNGPGLHLFQDASGIFLEIDQGNNMQESHGILLLQSFLATFELQRICGSRTFGYPLVNQHSNGKSPCLMGKSTINGHFQLLFWHNQRVLLVIFGEFWATWGICRFEHPTGRRRDLMPATSQRESSRHRSVSRDHEEVVARMDLDPDYCSRVARWKKEKKHVTWSNSEGLPLTFPPKKVVIWVYIILIHYYTIRKFRETLYNRYDELGENYSPETTS